jgi:hypothetical protein
LLRIPEVAGPATARLAASVAPAAANVPINFLLFILFSPHLKLPNDDQCAAAELMSPHSVIYLKTENVYSAVDCTKA